jgi:hypothetical protein
MTESDIRADERRKCAEEIRAAAETMSTQQKAEALKVYVDLIDAGGMLLLVRATMYDAADVIDPAARSFSPTPEEGAGRWH